MPDLTGLVNRLRWPIVVVVLVLLLALALEGGFYFGQRAAYQGLGAKPKAYNEMQAELLAVQNALRSRNAELAIQATRNEVDRHALELVRRELAEQKQEIAGLVEGLGFYRSLMSPEGSNSGLSLRGLELMAGDKPREYFYRIVVQQDARNHEQLKGELTAVVTGFIGEQPIAYSLAELGGDASSVTALSFRYFQSVKGKLVLPEGFEPNGVIVEAKSVAPHSYQARTEYPWQLEERFSNVGK